MHDASTQVIIHSTSTIQPYNLFWQTTNDASTQTEEQSIEVIRETAKMISVFEVERSNAGTGMDPAELSERLKNITIGVQTLGDSVLRKPVPRSPENIMTGTYNIVSCNISRFG